MAQSHQTKRSRASPVGRAAWLALTLALVACKNPVITSGDPGIGNSGGPAPAQPNVPTTQETPLPASPLPGGPAGNTTSDASANTSAFKTTFEGKEYSLTKVDMEVIGEQIFKSETGGDPLKLVFWNAAEAFPSLGIGHFIWFPRGCNACAAFGSGPGSFPGLAEDLRKRGVVLPGFVFANGGYPPWPSRSAFLADTARVGELRKALESSKGTQARYIIETNMAKLTSLAQSNKAVLAPRIATVLASKGGAFLLVDYINFKGDGASGQPRGWGLKQVLESMREGSDAASSFATAADFVLTRRTQDRPADRQFLAGWRVRINRYRTFVLPSRGG